MPPRQRAATTASARRPVRDANFLPKRERKQVRKGMVRAYLANRVSEARVGAAARAEFYRNLRHMKMRRRMIAKEMRLLADTVAGLMSGLRRVEDREPDANLKILDEALDLTRSAVGSAESAAAEWELFARRRIYYTEAM